MRAEAAPRHNIDAAREQALQFLDELQIIAEATILRYVNKKVDIAVGPFLTACCRAE